MNDTVARELKEKQKRGQFSESVPHSPISDYIIDVDDMVETSIWEAPPPILFGSTNMDSSGTISTSAHIVLPTQAVRNDGSIFVPYAGRTNIAGLSVKAAEEMIAELLSGKANKPQVQLTLTNTSNASVTMVGEFVANASIPLGNRHVRILSAIASSGGVKNPTNKVTIQLTRDGKAYSMPLDAIIRDPKQNILLQPGDVLAAIHQPLSFTVLGATARNAEVDFEAQGVSLVQALARSGGLLDNRADTEGVFIFRYESPADLPLASAPEAGEGEVPVMYWVNFKNPASFFTAQIFPIKDNDVLYVSNAGAADLQKFLNILGSIFSPIRSFKVISDDYGL